MTDWQTIAKPIRPGDTVTMSALYVRNMDLPPEAAYRRGKVIKVESACDVTTALVDFGDGVRRVSVKGLEKAGEKAK